MWSIVMMSLVALGALYGSNAQMLGASTGAGSIAAVFAQEPNVPAPAAGQGRGGRGGQPIVLGPDDKPFAPPAPEGFNTPREGIPHGTTDTIDYDSKTVGNRRRVVDLHPAWLLRPHAIPRALPAAWHRRRRDGVAARCQCPGDPRQPDCGQEDRPDDRRHAERSGACRR